jgi:hypothetical protein
MISTSWALCGLVAFGVLAGCDAHPSLLPNSDTDLQKTSMEFAADAAKRTYESTAPRGDDSHCRAEIEYMLGTGQITITNVGDDDLSNIEVWLNQKYVVYIPKIAKGDDRTIPFKMTFDANGDYYVPDVTKSPTNVEIFHDGKMYTVTTQLPDK